jgi:hypothetical protein
MGFSVNFVKEQFALAAANVYSLFGYTILFLKKNNYFFILLIY